MTRLVIARDPSSGCGALYLNGSLVYDFYAADPFDGVLGNNQWDNALDALAEQLGWDYETESRHQLAREIKGPDYTEWDGYWPDQIEDAPLETFEEVARI